MSDQGPVHVPEPPPWLSRHAAARALTLYLLCVGIIVFWPSAWMATESVDQMWQVLQYVGAPTWLSEDTVEFVSNVLLFMPLSFLGSFFRPRWSWLAWGVVGLLGTLAVEGLQLLALPDRSPATADLIANTVGSVLGYGVVCLTRLRPR